MYALERSLSKFKNILNSTSKDLCKWKYLIGFKILDYQNCTCMSLSFLALIVLESDHSQK